MRFQRIILYVFLVALLALTAARFGMHRETKSAEKSGAPVATAAVSATEEQAPKAPDALASKTYSLFGHRCTVVAERLEPTGTPNRFVHARLIDTASELGLVRVETTVTRDPQTGQEQAGQTDAYVAADAIVTRRAGTTDSQVITALNATGATSWTHLYGSNSWVVHYPHPDLDTKPQALAALGARTTEISQAEGNGVGSGGFQPNDVYFPQQYSLNNTGQTGGTTGADIHVSAAWDVINASPNVVVAVLDSGIDFSHPDLQANIYTSSTEVAGNSADDDHNGLVDDVHGWDFVNNDNDPSDDHNHGSHVSGILGARGNNGTGVAGITWQVQIMPIKILDANNAGTTANLISGVNYAISKGVRLMNMSLQNYPYSSTLADSFTTAQKNDILLVICAGNNSSNNDVSPNYPSSYTHDNIIAVANTTSADVLNTGSGGSDYGPTSVDLAAPGTSIYSTVRGGYAYFSGTSMSTPHVTGVAALLLGLHPTATVAQLRHWILDTVDVVPALVGKCSTGGRLNAAAAIQASIGSPTITANPTTQVADTGSTVSLGVTTQGASDVRYQWYKDGVQISGANTAVLTLTNVQSCDAGNYSVLVQAGMDVVSSQAARVEVLAPGTSRITNLSIRAVAGSGNQTLIAGFVVEGDKKQILMRGVGPTLANYGVSNTLSDPQLTVYSGDSLLASNDDWGAASNLAQIKNASQAVNAFNLLAGSKDSAILQSFSPGAYTVLCTNPHGGSGVGLVELYDDDSSGASRLVNVSGRSQVGTGADVMIGGFIISGAAPRTLLIRGIGPGLAKYGVGNLLADPKLTVTALNGGTVAENDNWGGTTELQANFDKVGAFGLPTDSKDAALLVTLNPGAYTATLSGAGNTTGVALLEIYEVK